MCIRDSSKWWYQYAVMVANNQAYYFEYGYGDYDASRFRAEIDAILNSILFGSPDSMT